MRKFFGQVGSVTRIGIESDTLKANMLGDPSTRAVDVYLPAGHDGEGLPLLVDLVGFTSSGLSHTNWAGFRENLPERLDRLIGEQEGFELCYLPDMPAVLRALAGVENSIERWWQQLEAARKHPEGSGKVMNILAMAASYDPDPTQFLGIRLPVTLDTCEVIEERWANWLRQDPVVAIDTQADNLRRLKALYIDCGEKDQFNLLYGARRFAIRLSELGIAHRYEEFPDNHTSVDYRMDESLPFLARALTD
jgi:hypothetical protein